MDPTVATTRVNPGVKARHRAHRALLETATVVDRGVVMIALVEMAIVVVVTIVDRGVVMIALVEMAIVVVAIIVDRGVVMIAPVEIAVMVILMSVAAGLAGYVAGYGKRRQKLGPEAGAVWLAEAQRASMKIRSSPKAS